MTRARPTRFAAEADGLAALRAAGVRAPEPLATGVAAGQAYLLLEYLDLGGRRDFAALGRMLAEAHRKPGPRFGWHRDNYIGSTPQATAGASDWSRVLARAALAAATRAGEAERVLAYPFLR